jgi:Alpha-glutamyl/putrescinyl thymine pyrophosphorylase clade 3
VPLFCRHNRLTANCPICSREQEAELRAKAPPRPEGTRRRAAAAPRARRAATARTGAVVTRKLARAQDDGYRNQLVPGLRATADAERLASALLIGAARLDPPGPYETIATEPDREQATWLAFLLALAGPDAPELQEAIAAAAPRFGEEVAGLPATHERAVAAYRQWVAKAGSQSAAFTGEADWSPQRRFARVFERLALPGMSRAARFELLAVLGAAGLYELEPDQLQLGVEDDDTTQAAKRILLSGDKMLLERRARDLAAATGVPLAALDRAFALWGDPSAEIETADELPGAMRSALALR